MTQTFIQAGPYVFVSYMSGDRARVLPIARELEKAGVRVWIDLVNISAGANYGLEISEGIKNCSAVLIACSPAALQSRNVKQEIQLAWKHQRPYLPVLLEETTFPREIEYWLEGYQWVEILDRPTEQWLPLLLASLRKLKVPVSPVYAARANAAALPGGTGIVRPSSDRQAVAPVAAPPAAAAPAAVAPAAVAPAAVAPAVAAPTPAPAAKARSKTPLLMLAAGVAAVLVICGVLLAVAPWNTRNVSSEPPDTINRAAIVPTVAATGVSAAATTRPAGTSQVSVPGGAATSPTPSGLVLPMGADPSTGR